MKKKPILEAFDIIIDRYRNPKDNQKWIREFIFGPNPQNCPFCVLFLTPKTLSTETCFNLNRPDCCGCPVSKKWKLKGCCRYKLSREILDAIKKYIIASPDYFIELKKLLNQAANRLEKMRKKYE